LTDGFYYFYSTVAQVVATLLGLLLATYAIYQNHLKTLVEKDDSYSDAVKQLLKIQSRRVNVLLITSFVIIVASIGMLRIGETQLTNNEMVTQIEFYIILVPTYQFFRIIYTMVNQNAISDQANSILERLNHSKASVTLQEFMSFYILFEKEIENRFYRHFPNFPEKYLSVSRMVRELVYAEPEIEIMFSEIKEIIKVRNLLVHGKSQAVPAGTFNRLKNVLDKMKIDYAKNLNHSKET